MSHYIDGGMIAIWSFWIFFFSLVIYLRREDKREGYPLESPQGPREGWPTVPGRKTYLHGPHNTEGKH